MRKGRKPLLQPIFGAAALAGTLDLGGIFALLSTRGTGPERILQTVASGWYGKAAFTGGARTAAVGFVAHYAIMLAFAAAYVLASRSMLILWRRPVASGALYGLLTFALMNYVVVPYSAAARWPHWDPVTLAHALVVHIVFVGLVIAWYARGANR